MFQMYEHQDTMPRSWWWKRTVNRLLAEPLTVPILEGGCLEVVTFFISGAGSPHVFALSTAEAERCVYNKLFNANPSMYDGSCAK